MPSYRFSLHHLVFSLLITSFAVNIAAEEGFNTPSGNQFKLSLASEVGSINNFLYHSNNEQSTSFVKLSPSFFLQTEFERQLFNIEMSSSHYKFQDFSQDDHSDLSLGANYQYKLSDNKAWFAKGSLRESYEYRGTGVSLGDANQLSVGDERQGYDFRGGYLYGNADSVAKLKIALGLSDNGIKTRRQKTRFLDSQSQFALISFDYLLSGASYLTADVHYQSVSAKFNPSQDKNSYTGLVGFKWQSSDITQLEALVGYQTVNFKEATFDNDSAFKWRVNLLWSPLESTRVILGTERDFQEANRLSNSYRVVDSYKVNLVNDFTEFFQSSINISYQDEAVIFIGSQQKEAYLATDIKLNYQRNDWLSVYFQYTYQDLNSDRKTLSYQRNEISLGFSVSIY